MSIGHGWTNTCDRRSRPTCRHSRLDSQGDGVLCIPRNPLRSLAISSRSCWHDTSLDVSFFLNASCSCRPSRESRGSIAFVGSAITAWSLFLKGLVCTRSGFFAMLREEDEDETSRIMLHSDFMRHMAWNSVDGDLIFSNDENWWLYCHDDEYDAGWIGSLRDCNYSSYNYLDSHDYYHH